MRTFFRRYFTHNRYVSSTATPLDALQLDAGGAARDLAGLYLDLRPFVNRSPFTVRKDCSASRAHQVRALRSRAAARSARRRSAGAGAGAACAPA
jgi:chloride channel 7